MQKFGFSNFFVRWIAALALVSLTYNPSGFSYYHWVAMENRAPISVQVLSGLVMVVLYAIFVRATVGSIGGIGVTLLAAVLGALTWVFIDIGWLDLNNATMVSWVAIIVLSTVMGVGLSWSHVRRRISGQVSTDEVES